MLAVIGIGLNLQMPAVAAEELQQFLHRPAALAQALSPAPDRHRLLAQLLLDLAAVLDDFSAGGFSAVRDEWQTHHVWQDRQVRLLNDGQLDRQGTCLGADADGALLSKRRAGSNAACAAICRCKWHEHRYRRGQ